MRLYPQTQGRLSSKNRHETTLDIEVKGTGVLEVEKVLMAAGTGGGTWRGGFDLSLEGWAEFGLLGVEKRWGEYFR